MKNPEQNGLERFHPRIAGWFEERCGRPTPMQQQAWSLIAAGNHVLVTAPTGSGKTLAAFLWSLDRLIRGRWALGQTRVLYVSPLKALNNDIQRNLMRPLAEIRQLFADARMPFPTIRVNTRSGDTPSHERRQIIRRPPEILITTPESLHIMLASHGGRSILNNIQTVIMDEIHAVIGNKRGTLLISAIDRLVPLCGEFQRIALSATVNPEATVADFIGGFRVVEEHGTPVYIPRSVKRCRSPQRPQSIIHVRIPQKIIDGSDGQSVWDDLAETFKKTITEARSTIIFVNSRQLCEKLTFLINADRRYPIAYAHHGSLSRELRLEVERRLKQGHLKAIVATASLELGIDIGSLDHVILVQSPPSVSSAVQRIGRSGHTIGSASMATFYATHAADLMTAAVLARCAATTDIEPVRPVECPLDVLAQVIVAMTGVESWNRDDLYHSVRASYPYRHLQRQIFDLVVAMLSGRYAKTQVAALKAKIAFDRLEDTLTARKGSLISLYMSGGVIPDRGYFRLYHHETGSFLGELDEEFVWEARQGQIFTLGTQNWRIQRITQNSVLVSAAQPKAPAPPFWRAEEASRDFHLSDKIGLFLESAHRRLYTPGFMDELIAGHGLDKSGARFLIDFLLRQQEKSGCPLPHRHHVVIERTPSRKHGPPMDLVVIHTFWGGRVNRPYALALEAALKERCGQTPTVFPTNDAVFLLMPEGHRSDNIATLVSPGNVEKLLRRQLEGSGMFGARFRECAARALLLPRNHFKQRLPLWLSRQKSQKLLEALGRFPDFPILLETWRSCLQDDFDMPALATVLQEVESGVIAWSEVRTAAPSPMAQSGSWRLINHYMYADDRQPGRVEIELEDDLLRQVVFDPDWRCPVDQTTIREFQEKRQRVHPGYAPNSPVELLEWVKERLLIPVTEWERLLQRIETDSDVLSRELVAWISKKLLRLAPGADRFVQNHLVVAIEDAFHVVAALYPGRKDLQWFDLSGRSTRFDEIAPASAEDHSPNAADIVAQWLRYYGPLPAGFIRHWLNLDESTLNGILEELEETRTIVAGNLMRDEAKRLVCDADNFDTLLRMSRRRRRPEIQPKDVNQLSMYLAHFQGIADSTNGNHGDLKTCLEQLMCLPLSAAAWETDVLPARIGTYDPQQLDRLMRDSPLMWIGFPGRQVAFCHADDIDLLADGNRNDGSKAADGDLAATEIARLFRDPRAAYSLSALLDDQPRSYRQLEKSLWDAVWAGKVTNDTMNALRRGLARRFKTTESVNAMPTTATEIQSRSWHRRRRRSIQKQGAWVGNWRLVKKPLPPEGLMETADLVKDRVRLLLDRYGILFRQMLSRELDVFQWPAIFKALRLMELSGEVVGGCFFKDIPGLQFVSQRMLEMIGKTLPEDCLYWISAQDPISLCGLGLDALKGALPRRAVGTHLVYLGSRLVMISTRKGKRLEINLPIGHERLPDCFVLFDHLLGRRIDPLRMIAVETINDREASGSAYAEVLAQRFDTVIEAPKIMVFRRLAT